MKNKNQIFKDAFADPKLYSLSCRVTREEREHVKAFVKENGTSVSKFLRALLFEVLD